MLSYFAAPGVIKRPITNKVNNIIDTICLYNRVTREQLNSKTRVRNIVYSRQLCMYLIREKTMLPLKKIGLLFGGRDHTTAIHSCKHIQDLLFSSDIVRADVERLKEVI